MTPDNPQVAQSWLDLAMENRGTDRFQISSVAFRSILRGYGPTRDELAGMTQLDPDTARELIEAMLHEGRLRIDQSEKRIVGAGGLSLEPARQSLVIGSRTFGTWCALDAVGIPAGLGIDAMVAGTCDDSGDPVRIEILNGDVVQHTPDNLRISLITASLALSVYTHL